jgi:peptidoglycan hydrolase-like protein with peptidoglycan-binding domain
MNSGLSVYAGYGRGSFTNMSAVESRFPGAKYVSVSPYVTTGVDCLDVEPGDASPSDAPAFVRNCKTVNTVKPVIYANASTMGAVKDALNAAGISRTQYFLWVAEWDGSAAIPQGYDGKQYASTSGYDADSFYDYMFGPSVPVNPFPLKIGSSGAQVTALQNLLNTLGFKPVLKVDGQFGPATEAAVVQAQHKYGYAPPTILGVITEAYYAGLDHHAHSTPPLPPPVVTPVSAGICAPVSELKLVAEGPHSYKIKFSYNKQGTANASVFQIAASTGSHLGKQVPSYPRTVKFTKLGLYTEQYGGVVTKDTDYIVAVRAIAKNGHQASEWSTIKLPKK